MASDGIICQGCGLEAPVKGLQFHQNIGMLVARQTSYIKGNLCKNCAHSHFWKKTGVTLLIGWLGTISIILAPIFVLMNLFHYIRALGMPAVPPGASRPKLDDGAAAKLAPFGSELIARVNNKESVNVVARDLAARVGVTPGQVIVYVQYLAAAARQAPPPQKTYGFPVQPVAAAPVPALPLAPPPLSVRALPPETSPQTAKPPEAQAGEPWGL